MLRPLVAHIPSMGLDPLVRVAGASELCFNRCTLTKSRYESSSLLVTNGDSTSSLASSMTISWLPCSFHCLSSFLRSSQDAHLGLWVSPLPSIILSCWLNTDLFPPLLLGLYPNMILKCTPPTLAYQVQAHFPMSNWSVPHLQALWAAWSLLRSVQPPTWCGMASESWWLYATEVFSNSHSPRNCCCRQFF